MTPPVDGPVVVDRRRLQRSAPDRKQPPGVAYRPIIDGGPLVISFVTRAELRYGASLGNWGVRRLARLDESNYDVRLLKRRCTAAPRALRAVSATRRTSGSRTGPAADRGV